MKPINLIQYRGMTKSIRKTQFSDVSVMTLKSGAEAAPDAAPQGDLILYVIEGKAKVEIGMEQCTLTAGMVLFISERSRHRMINIGTSDLFYMMIYTPPVY